MESSASIFDLLVNATLFVQMITVVLLGLSVLVWAIFFFTLNTLQTHQRALVSLKSLAQNTTGLERLYTMTQSQKSPIMQLFAHIFSLWKNFHTQPTYILEAALLRAESTALSAGPLVTWLATIASASPFIGLLGTVWGIMNSFQAIAVSQETHLSVVAPGIAEALAATALGLIAAIPASITFNYLTRRMEEYQTELEILITESIIALRTKSP
ncbi:MAG: MotA/TolQ/ExbB proton channel family protein [Alphaproteobacteria bacterium]|nr:MotA/TolQ/ExbB proton channel family protein [Alphaproteobacteria bacterium]